LSHLTVFMAGNLPGTRPVWNRWLPSPSGGVDSPVAVASGLHFFCKRE
jgi:hypothetical protein